MIFRSLGLNNSSGFTLIEVLISMAILAFISLGIYNAMSETFRLRDEISVEGDFYNNIRMAMTLLNRDIAMMYSPTIMTGALQNVGASPSPGVGFVPGQPAPASMPAAGPTVAPDLSGIDQDTAGQLLREGDYWGPALDKSGLRPMRLVGQDTSIRFITNSHNRIYKDSPESEIVKVRYELQKDDKTPEDIRIPDSSILVRVENPDAFDLDEIKGRDKAHAYPLLTGVTKLVFKYCRMDGDTVNCKSHWDSFVDSPQNTYPTWIQAYIEVKGPQRLAFTGTYFFKPEVPLSGLVPSY